MIIRYWILVTSVRNNTEKKLIEAIADHKLNNTKDKLTIQLLCLEVGISRQSFNKYYNHLKPYVKGDRAIEELLISNELDVPKRLEESQELARTLRKELEMFEAKSDRKLRSALDSIVTTLMDNDITIHDSNEIRKTMEQQAMQNDLLVRRNTRLEHELSLCQSRMIQSKEGLSSKLGTSKTKYIFEPDMQDAYAKLLKTNDYECFEEDKYRAVLEVVKQVTKAVKIDDVIVVIFVERYLSSFDKFVENYPEDEDIQYLYVRLPIYNKIELKLFAKNIGYPNIEVYVPYIDSVSLRKAQRSFLFRNIPNFEFESADTMSFPSIEDGYDSVTIGRVVTS